MSSDSEANPRRGSGPVQDRQPVRRRRKRRCLLASGLAAGLGLGLGAWYIWHDLHAPIAPPPGGVILPVPPGAPFREIAMQMHHAGVLRHPRLLTVWARLWGSDRRVRSGEYRIDDPVAPTDLIAMLQLPTRALHWVTIPEGYTAGQVAVALEREGFGGADVFACAMRDPVLLYELDLPSSGVEGFLFPDTYAFTWSTEPTAILRAMVQRYRDHAHTLAARRSAAGLTELEMVTLASIIEKETGKAEERPLISGVFHNRLRVGMPLQSDPTVIYGLDEYSGRLSRADLLHASPYNTYVHAGLPPGPIANPGLASLEAAIAPAGTDALYFVSRNDGSHEFSVTLTEHHRAVRRYQRTVGGRQPAAGNDGKAKGKR